MGSRRDVELCRTVVKKYVLTREEERTDGYIRRIIMQRETPDDAPVPTTTVPHDWGDVRVAIGRDSATDAEVVLFASMALRVSLRAAKLPVASC
jgi:hypothetical protein